MWQFLQREPPWAGEWEPRSHIVGGVGEAGRWAGLAGLSEQPAPEQAQELKPRAGEWLQRGTERDSGARLGRERGGGW